MLLKLLKSQKGVTWFVSSKLILPSRPFKKTWNSELVVKNVLGTQFFWVEFPWRATFKGVNFLPRGNLLRLSTCRGTSEEIEWKVGSGGGQIGFESVCLSSSTNRFEIKFCHILELTITDILNIDNTIGIIKFDSINSFHFATQMV